MTLENKYLMLKQLAILMALDTGGAVADAIALFIYANLDSANLPAASLPPIRASAAGLYISWTLLGVRLLIWTLTLALLPRMTRLHPSFGKARICYLLRILAFAAEIIAAGATQYAYYRMDAEADMERLRFFAMIIFLELGLNLLWEVLFLSFGNRAILAAGAELLETFGLTGAAKEARRHGKWLIGFAGVYTFFCIFALALLLICCLEFPEGVPNALSLTDAAAFLLCVPAWLGVAVCRILAPLRMKRVYRLVRELSE